MKPVKEFILLNPNAYLKNNTETDFVKDQFKSILSDNNKLVNPIDEELSVLCEIEDNKMKFKRYPARTDAGKYRYFIYEYNMIYGSLLWSLDTQTAHMKSKGGLVPTVINSTNTWISFSFYSYQELTDKWFDPQIENVLLKKANRGWTKLPKDLVNVEKENIINTLKRSTKIQYLDGKFRLY